MPQHSDEEHFSSTLPRNRLELMWDLGQQVFFQHWDSSVIKLALEKMCSCFRNPVRCCWWRDLGENKIYAGRRKCSLPTFTSCPNPELQKQETKSAKTESWRERERPWCPRVTWDRRSISSIWSNTVHFLELNYSRANAAFYSDNDEIHFRECRFILVCLSVCLL